MVKRLKNNEVLAIAVILTFVLVFMFDVWDNPISGRIFPLIIGSIVLMLLVLQSVVVFKTDTEETEGTSSKTQNTVNKESLKESRASLVLIGLMLMYVLGIYTIGFLGSTFLFLIITMWTLGFRNKLIIMIIALLTLASVYLIFVVGFNFILPKGIFL